FAFSRRTIASAGWRKWAGSRRNWSSFFEAAMQPCLTCAVEFDGEDEFMNTRFFTVIALVAMSSFILSSCETPTGTGAGVGAATGAIIGAAATGHARGAALGAAAGAAAGAITGAAIQADQ